MQMRCPRTVGLRFAFGKEKCFSIFFYVMGCFTWSSFSFQPPCLLYCRDYLKLGKIFFPEEDRSGTARAIVHLEHPVNILCNPSNLGLDLKHQRWDCRHHSVKKTQVNNSLPSQGWDQFILPNYYGCVCCKCSGNMLYLFSFLSFSDYHFTLKR